MAHSLTEIIQDFDQDPTQHITNQEQIPNPPPLLYGDYNVYNSSFTPNSQYLPRPYNPYEMPQDDKRRRSTIKTQRVVKNPHPFYKDLKRSTVTAYSRMAFDKNEERMPENAEDFKENTCWNSDPKTAPYFEKGLRKHQIPYPIRERESADDGWNMQYEFIKPERTIGTRDINLSENFEARKHDFFTDFEEFTRQLMERQGKIVI